MYMSYVVIYESYKTITEKYKCHDVFLNHK